MARTKKVTESVESVEAQATTEETTQVKKRASKPKPEVFYFRNKSSQTFYIPGASISPKRVSKPYSKAQADAIKTRIKHLIDAGLVDLTNG